MVLIQNALLRKATTGHYDAKTCTRIILSLIDRPLSENVIGHLQDACIGNTSELKNRKDMSIETLFSRIFENNNFPNVTCRTREAGPPDVDRGLVALASFPGSGNTWTRHLLEQLTGQSYLMVEHQLLKLCRESIRTGLP